MKCRVTKKEIRNSFQNIISIGYCDAQFLLQYRSPFAYSAGTYGWACDYYDLGTTCISTGYSPLNGLKPDYDLLRRFEENAQRIVCGDLDYETKKARVDELLYQFVDAVLDGGQA